MLALAVLALVIAASVLTVAAVATELTPAESAAAEWPGKPHTETEAASQPRSPLAGYHDAGKAITHDGQADASPWLSEPHASAWPTIRRGRILAAYAAAEQIIDRQLADAGWHNWTEYAA